MVHALLNRPGDLVFAWLAGHFRSGRNWEKSLGGEKRVESPGKKFLRRRVETVIVEVGGADAPVMEHELNFMRPEVPQRCGIARDPPLNAVRSFPCRSTRPAALTALTDTERKAVRTAQIVVMACAAGDVPVARKYLVIEQKLTYLGLSPIELDEIVVRKWCRKIDRVGGQG